jgi:hypothetical protein
MLVQAFLHEAFEGLEDDVLREALSRSPVGMAGWVRHGDSLMSFDVQRMGQDFPILSQPQHGKQLVFLDSGA